MTGITLQELLEKYKTGNLLEDSELKPVGNERWERISKEGSSKDIKQSVIFINGDFCKNADIFEIKDEGLQINAVD